MYKVKLSLFKNKCSALSHNYRFYLHKEPVCLQGSSVLLPNPTTPDLHGVIKYFDHGSRKEAARPSGTLEDRC